MLHIQIPTDLIGSDIERSTFAFCKLSQSSNVALQFFSPLELELRNDRNPAALSGSSSLNFEIDKNSHRYKQIQTIGDKKESSIVKTEEFKSASEMVFISGSKAEIEKKLIL